MGLETVVRSLAEAGIFILFLSPHPDRIWGSATTYPTGNGALFPGIKLRDVKLTTYLHLLLWLRMRGAPVYLHGVVLN